MPPLQLAKHYFALSNTSDMAGIRALMTPGTTYSSANTGVYLGVDQIMEMQTRFLESFETLSWDVTSAEEVRPGVVRFEFVLSGVKHDGEQVRLSGVEYVIVYNGKLQHIEVRNA